ncbi:MAG: sel1 repeat family protein, partial [Gammaproteobacteria bacterium]|nr:sel1 repeat family protein [Gammaproteobacteria bacterium]
KGVKKNLKVAFNWYNKAAAQGHVVGQTNLGIMYELGHGTKQNLVQAYMWYTLSANKGHTKATRHRKQLAVKMTPEQLNRSETLAIGWNATTAELTQERLQLIVSN